MVAYDHRQERSEVSDLRHEAFHPGGGFDRYDDRKRLERDVDLNILFFPVVEKVELSRFQPVDNVARPIRHQGRRKTFVAVLRKTGSPISGTSVGA